MARKSDDLFDQLNNLNEERAVDGKIKRNPNSKKKTSAKYTQEPATKRNSNGVFLTVTIFSVLIFLGVAAYLVYFNIALREDYISSSYNKRQDSYADQIIRGDIVDKDGNLLATTNISDDGTETRVYPYSNLYSHIIGYSVYGNSGLEAKNNFDLVTCHENLILQIKNDMANVKNTGDTIVTTLDTNLQQTAANALGSQKGAVVCMEPSTGKILAMYSNPTYDPNSVEANWDELNSEDNEDSPLLNRATNGLFTPGSTFKIVTALEYMRENKNYSNFSFDCTGSVTYGDTTVKCYNGTSHGELDFSTAFAYSCNSAFLTIGKELNTKKYINTANELLFNTKLPAVVATSQSQFALTTDSAVITKMMTAMGQGDTLVSPYHMALIASSIANGGILMKPYVVSNITNHSGTTISTTKPKKYAELMTASEASALTGLMKGVCEYGTASALSGHGYTVAGKTGTAEYSSDKSKSHSWFVGFSNTDNPDLVVSVVLEGSDGRMSATSVANALFKAYH